MVLARDMNRNFKRVNNMVMRQRRALAASLTHQENMQLRQEAIENTKVSTTNERLERRVLTLEMGQKAKLQLDSLATKTTLRNLREAIESSVTEVRNTERAAARQREQRLIKERDAANDRASNAITQTTYDSLRNSFNTASNRSTSQWACKDGTKPREAPCGSGWECDSRSGSFGRHKGKTYGRLRFVGLTS